MSAEPRAIIDKSGQRWIPDKKPGMYRKDGSSKAVKSEEDIARYHGILEVIR